MEAVSASGNLHPTILLKGKILQGCWQTHKIPRASYGNTEWGWASDKKAMTWLEGFAKSTKVSANTLFYLMQSDTYLLRAN